MYLDRQLISPAELLHVAGFQPHELTRRFSVAASPGSTHRVPWFDEDRSPLSNPLHQELIEGPDLVLAGIRTRDGGLEVTTAGVPREPDCQGPSNRTIVAPYDSSSPSASDISTPLYVQMVGKDYFTSGPQFQTAGPIIAQALFQRLAPRAPPYGANINYAGDQLEIYFDPAYTVTRGPQTFIQDPPPAPSPPPAQDPPPLSDGARLRIAELNAEIRRLIRLQRQSRGSLVDEIQAAIDRRLAAILEILREP